ncbi:type IV secretory system conjugative DNA transfer family protein [Erysipelothrix aquatica]|uniref:type IV secretory system conjugative DNA transfer family protein n=1 Tax=Erysipelothrix aquatica TaxID=2683714 RepID=UPI001358E55C|nr:type IV secretion system DNA-binding domain-containing protein [Erysipelothrix aquatica]
MKFQEFTNIILTLILSSLVPVMIVGSLIGLVFIVYSKGGEFSTRMEYFYQKTQFNIYNIAFLFCLYLAIVLFLLRDKIKVENFMELYETAKTIQIKSLSSMLVNVNVFEYWVIGSVLVAVISLRIYAETWRTAKAKTQRKRRREMWKATWFSFRKPSELIDDNTIVLGATRAGKTAWIRRVIQALLKSGRPLIIVDGKGDIADRSLYEGAAKLARLFKRPLYVIDQTNIKNSDSYNPFKRCRATEIKDMLQEMGDWSVNAAHYKELAGRYWQMMASYMITFGIPRNFKNIIKYSNPYELAEHILKNSELDGPHDDYISLHLRNQILDRYGEKGLSNLRTPYLKIMVESAEGVEKNTASFATVYEGEGRAMFGENEGFDIEDVIRNNGVLIVLLNSMTYTDFSISTGALVIQDFKNTMGRRMSRKETEKVTAIFEELGAFFSDSVVDLSARIGSLGGNVIYSIQGFSDMDVHDKNIRRQIVNNTNRFFTFRLNDPDDAIAMSDILGTVHATSETQQTESSGVGDRSTGMGTSKSEREYVFSPEVIKTLPTVRGIFLVKDNIYSKPYIFKVKFLNLDDIKEPTKAERQNRIKTGDWLMVEDHQS